MKWEVSVENFFYTMLMLLDVYNINVALKFKLLLSANMDRSNLYLKLFKLVFGSVSLFASENEQMLKVRELSVISSLFVFEKPLWEKSIKHVHVCCTLCKFKFIEKFEILSQVWPLQIYYSLIEAD